VRQIFPLVLLLTIAAVLVPGSARPAATAGTPLTGAVGQGDSFSITLKDAAGHAVTQLDPGAYTITVTDYSTLHNFHLFGPGGVDQATDVDGTGTVTWDVTVSDGVYTYRCDAHPTQMKHTFRVGPAPPATPKLSGKVGPGNTISLKEGSTIVKALKAGTYKVTVKDASAKDNFHLLGPGISKRTAVRGKGTVTWKLVFKKGKYTYRSDAHKTLKRTFKVLAPPPKTKTKT